MFQRDLINQEDVLNHFNVACTLPCNFSEHSLNAGVEMTMICGVISVLQLLLASGLLNPYAKQATESSCMEPRKRLEVFSFSYAFLHGLPAWPSQLTSHFCSRRC